MFSRFACRSFSSLPPSIGSRNPFLLSGYTGGLGNSLSLKPVSYDSTTDATPELKQGKRQFKPKETYAPRDLNQENVDRHLHNQGLLKKKDYFAVHGIDPLKVYKNTRLLSEFGIL
jgi:hypothetical protein